MPIQQDLQSIINDAASFITALLAVNSIEKLCGSEKDAVSVECHQREMTIVMRHVSVDLRGQRMLTVAGAILCRLRHVLAACKIFDRCLLKSLPSRSVGIGSVFSFKSFPQNLIEGLSVQLVFFAEVKVLVCSAQKEDEWSGCASRGSLPGPGRSETGGSGSSVSRRTAGTRALKFHEAAFVEKTSVIGDW